MPGITAYTFVDPKGKVLSSNNGNTLIMPASNMKVVSGYSAYRILGKDFTFRTQFSHEGRDLIVSGDPALLLDHPGIAEIGRKIAARNPVIENIVLNTSSLDRESYGPGWMMEDNRFTYQAKIAPFTLNEGSMPSKSSQHIPETIDDAHSEGLVPSRNQERYFAENLWAAMGLSPPVSYKISNSRIAPPLETYSVPLRDVLRHIETHSCNFSAEILTKYLSRFTDGSPGNWSRGTRLILDLMKNMGLDTDEIRIADGSGLSRLNLLTTDFLARLIHRISDSDDREFLEILPEPGEGTLRNRLSDLKDLGIHAKTGSISYCSSLTGYIGSMGISFSIALNHFTMDDNDLAKLVDNILRNEIRDFSGN